MFEIVVDGISSIKDILFHKSMNIDRHFIYILLVVSIVLCSVDSNMNYNIAETKTLIKL